MGLSLSGAMVRRPTTKQPFVVRNGLLKAAGNDSLDAPIEQIFGSMAHAYIQDRVPKLAEREIGFQLIDKNDDESRAAGVMTFKFGDQYVHVLMIYNNRQIRCHDQMYVPNQDLVLPNTEQWVDYIATRKPVSTGESSPSPTNSRSSGFPDLRFLLHPFAKVGAVGFDDADSAHLLPRLLEHGPLSVATKLAATVAAYPDFADLIARTYGQAVPEAVMRRASRAEKEAAARTPLRSPLSPVSEFDELDLTPLGPAKQADLTFTVQHISISGTGPLSDIDGHNDDAENNVVIEDNRPDDDVSFIYDDNPNLTLRTPSESGLYDVLVNADDMEKMLVFVSPMAWSKRVRGCLVVDLDKKSGRHRATLTHSDNVYVGHKYDQTEFWELIKDLPDASSLPQDREAGNYEDQLVMVAPEGIVPAPFTEPRDREAGNHDNKLVVVTSQGDATAPFTVLRSLPESDSCKSYEIRFDTHLEGHDLPSTVGTVSERDDHYMHGAKPEDNRPRFRHRQWYTGTLNLLSRKGTKFTVAGPEIMAPDSCKLLKISTDRDEALMMLGSAVDAKMGLRKFAEKLSAFGDGITFTINGKRANSRDSLIHLVRDWGLREKSAREVLKAAVTSHDRRLPARFLVRRSKRADYPGVQTGPIDPSIPDRQSHTEDVFGRGVQSQQPQLDVMPATGAEPNLNSPESFDYSPIDSITMRNVQDAAMTGKKNVVDVSACAALLRGSDRPEALPDKLLEAMVPALDEMGRFRYQLAWDRQIFEDRYGESDAAKLDSNLETCYREVGDLVLALKEKTIDSDVAGSLRFE